MPNEGKLAKKRDNARLTIRLFGYIVSYMSN